jgi:hypothetical protein
MKNCANCGQVNYENQMNCGRCGAVLNQPNFPPNPQGFNQPYGNRQQGFNQPNYNPAMPMPAKKSHVGKILAVFGVTVVLFALVGGGVFFLLITQTTRWKIQGKWSLDSATMGGISAPLGDAKGTTVEYFENMTVTTTLPNGTTEHGTYKIINEKTISTTDRSNQTITQTVSFDGNKMTQVSTKNNVNITIIYYRKK